MSHLEKVVSASRRLVKVSTLNGIIDIDRIAESEYRGNPFDFELDEQQTLWDVVRTMFGDYLIPGVKLDDILQLGVLDREAAIQALVMAYGVTKENESL